MRQCSALQGLCMNSLWELKLNIYCQKSTILSYFTQLIRENQFVIELKSIWGWYNNIALVLSPNIDSEKLLSPKKCDNSWNNNQAFNQRKANYCCQNPYPFSWNLSPTRSKDLLTDPKESRNLWKSSLQDWRSSLSMQTLTNSLLDIVQVLVEVPQFFLISLDSFQALRIGVGALLAFHIPLTLPALQYWWAHESKYHSSWEFWDFLDACHVVFCLRVAFQVDNFWRKTSDSPSFNPSYWCSQSGKATQVWVGSNSRLDFS